MENLLSMMTGHDGWFCLCKEREWVRIIRMSDECGIIDTNQEDQNGKDHYLHNNYLLLPALPTTTTSIYCVNKSKCVFCECLFLFLHLYKLVNSLICFYEWHCTSENGIRKWFEQHDYYGVTMLESQT